MLNAILSLFRMILLLLGGYEQIALENLALREQLAIFQRSVRHPKIRPMDRLFWVCLRKVWKEWKSALVMIFFLMGHTTFVFGVIVLASCTAPKGHRPFDALHPYRPATGPLRPHLPLHLRKKRRI